MTNEERIRKWRQSGRAEAQQMADDALAPQPKARAIPGRREEELEAAEAMRAEIADGKLPTDDDIGQAAAAEAQRRWWHGMAVRRRAAKVIGLPLLAVLLYAIILAPAEQKVGASFVIMRAGGDGGGATAGLLGIGGGEGLGDAYRIREYLKSREAMQAMEKRYGFLTHFREGSRDPLSRPIELPQLGIDAHSFYQRKIHIGIDVREGIVRLDVEALTPEDSRRFARGLLDLARERTQAISDQLNADQAHALKKDVERAQEGMREASGQLAAVQRKKRELDPAAAGAMVYQLVGSMEGSLAEKQAQRDSILANGMTESPLLARIDAEIASLRQQIARQRERLAGGNGDSSLASATADITQATTQLRLRQAGLESSLRTFEQAQLSSIEQRRYLVVIAEPVLPRSIWASHLLELLGLTFVATLLVWGVAGLLRTGLHLGNTR